MRSSSSAAVRRATSGSSVWAKTRGVADNNTAAQNRNAGSRPQIVVLFNRGVCIKLLALRRNGGSANQRHRARHDRLLRELLVSFQILIETGVTNDVGVLRNRLKRSGRHR